MATVIDLVPGTEVEARGLRWRVLRVDGQTGSRVCRLRGQGGVASGEEVDVLLDIEEVRPIRHEIDPKRAGRLRDWLLYHQAFLLEQALGPHAMLAAQPGRLEIQPYQLVPVIRALSMSRVRMLLGTVLVPSTAVARSSTLNLLRPRPSEPLDQGNN